MTDTWVPDPAPTSLAPGVFACYSPKPGSHTGVVTMVVARSVGLAVFDTGVAAHMPDAVRPALRLLGARESEITVLASTHGHPDHTGGSAALAGSRQATVYAPEHDRRLLDFTPDVWLSGGEQIDLGHLRFEVIATPGHTAGSVCFYEPTVRLLIAGDAVQGTGGGGLLPVYYRSGASYRAGLATLLAVPIDTLVLGHPVAWGGAYTNVIRGTDCAAYLSASLTASERIADAVRQDAGRHVSFAAATHAALARLTALPPFTGDGALDPQAADNAATLLSEMRDLGLSFDDAPQITKGGGA